MSDKRHEMTTPVTRAANEFWKKMYGTPNASLVGIKYDVPEIQSTISAAKCLWQIKVSEKWLQR